MKPETRLARDTNAQKRIMTALEQLTAAHKLNPGLISAYQKQSGPPEERAMKQHEALAAFLEALQKASPTKAPAKAEQSKEEK
jgi:hypothetical protein